MQSELDSLANVKTTAVANKASKQQQIVCPLLPTLGLALNKAHAPVANERKDPNCRIQFLLRLLR